MQLTVADQNIDSKIDNTTQMHNQRYLDCKETVVSLNEQTQRNVSQQIELQATKCSEGINALQLLANNSNRAIQMVQMDIRNFGIKSHGNKHQHQSSGIQNQEAECNRY